MDAWSELRLRCARRRAEDLGGLSESAFRELELAVEGDPEGFVSERDERALLVLARALDRVAQEREGDDLLDDEQFARERARRMAWLADECGRALELDPGCLDARTLRAVALHGDEPDELLEALLRVEGESAGAPGAPRGGAPGAWADPLARPGMRLSEAIARACLDTARHRMAIERCRALVGLDPSDPLGARLTLSVALARMEDEDALDALDARFGRRGNAWMSLSRTLLLYKLGRRGAARRALSGLCRTCEGAAYALLRPTYVDEYLPDRPAFRPGSYREALLATHEADPAVSDTPDFVGWASEQPGVLDAARSFARDRGLEW